MLDSLERERTHKITKELEDGCGTISLLLTISGTTASETISDLTTYEENSKELEAIINRYVSKNQLISRVARFQFLEGRDCVYKNQ